MADEIRDAIEENAAAGVQSVTTDGTNVQAMSIKDQILADQYVGGNAAASQPHRGLRFTKIVPPGCG